MPYIPNYEVKQFATGGTTWSVDLTVLSQEYYIYGSGTMTGNSSMAGTGTPLDGMVLNVYYSGNFVLNGSTITIFGQSLTQQQAQTNCYIKVRYDGTTAAWDVLIFADDSELPQGNDGVNTFALTNAGATETLVAGIDKRYQHITGSGITLLGSWVWTAGGTPIEGDEFMVHFNAANTVLNGNTITIFGQNITALMALQGDCFVYAIYNGSTWDSVLMKTPNVDDFRVMGSSSDTTPAYLDSKVKNSIEVDSNQLQLVGDAASPGNSYYYGTNGAGAKGFYAASTIGGGLWEAGSGTLSAQTVGTTCTASGDYSVALGLQSNANGAISYCEGSLCYSSGDYSHAEGNQSESRGDISHAEGAKTLASGVNSHSQNSETIASGRNSDAYGEQSVAHLWSSSAFSSGKFNITGDCEELKLFLKRATTNAVAANMLLGDGVTTGIEIPTDSTVDFHVRYVALVTGGVAGTAGDTMVQEQKFSVQNLAGVLTLLTQAQVTTAGITVVAGNIIKYDAATINALACDLTPTISGTKLLFTVTGVADTDINHGCLVNMVIMGHNNFVI